MTTVTPAPPVLPGLLYAQAAEFQDRLVALEDDAAEAMAQAWRATHAATQRDMDALLERWARAQAAGQRISPAWAFQEARYREFLATAEAQTAQFTRTATDYAERTQAAAAQMGATSAASLGSAALAQTGITAAFTGVNPDNLRHLVGFTQDGTPLADLFASLGPDSLAQARQVLTEGMVLGKGAPWLRKRLQKVLDVPRWRAQTIARTEAHRVFRAASRETYLRNADTLEGWVWTAHLDHRTCPGCLAMHGQVLPVTETLDGHPRCRCAMVPRTKSWEDLGVEGVPDTRPLIQSGEQWLNAQAPYTQRAILGPGKFAAWREGRMDLQDMVTQQTNPRWGTMRRESTLAEAIAAKTARTRAAAATAPAPRPAAPKRARTTSTPEGWTSLDRDAIQARYGGDMMRNRAAQAIREVWDTDGATVVLEVPMTAAQRAAFLGDVRAVTREARQVLGDAPVEYRVPARDRKFGTRGRGVTGGYVTMGTRQVNVHPKIARGEFEDLMEANAAHFMPAAQGVGMRRWVLTHETGHVVDGTHHHTWQPGGRTPSGYELPHTTTDTARTLADEHRAALGAYGRSKPVEAYAEVFAEWLSGGTSTVVQDYARRFGWTR